MTTLRLALAQMNATVGDLDGNARRIRETIARAEELGADAVCFPELALTGYPPEDLLLKPHFIRQNRERLDAIVRSTGDILAIVGFIDGQHGELYNSAAIIHRGSLIDVYHKMLLPNYAVFDEKRYFQPGTECAVYVLDGVSFGVNVCEDIWYPEGPTLVQARLGAAQLILNINSSPYHTQKWRVRQDMLSRRARENGVYIAYTNLVGGQDELVFDGHSLVFGPDGALLAQGRQFEEELLLFDLSLERRHNPLEDDPPAAAVTRLEELPEAYVTSPAVAATCRRVQITGGIKEKRDAVPPSWAEPLSEEGEIYEALALGLRDYVRKNGFSKVVMGLSGGIDSALTAVLAADALGTENVVGVAMPSTYSSAGSIEDSERLAENLGIELLKIPIQKIFQSYLGELAPVFAGREPDVAEENLQPRIRGNLLMALSNKFGWLVLSTGNKSETACGYATLYGDMAGGLAVIKDVPKMLVYRLAEYKNQAAGRELIPRNTIEKAPSAELRPGQLDTDSLPPYEALDPIIEAYVEEDRSLEEIVAMGHSAEIVKRVIRMVDRNEYKRRQGPPGIKITPKAFGKDRRMPITNRYRG